MAKNNVTASYRLHFPVLALVVSLLFICNAFANETVTSDIEISMFEKLASASSESKGRQAESVIWEYWFNLAPTIWPPQQMQGICWTKAAHGARPMIMKEQKPCLTRSSSLLRSISKDTTNVPLSGSYERTTPAHCQTLRKLWNCIPITSAPCLACITYYALRVATIPQ